MANQGQTTQQGLEGLTVAAREAALVPGITVRATDSLRRLVEFVRPSQ